MVIRHIPGVANSVPDALSRLTAPSPASFPDALSGAARNWSPARDRSFWVTSEECWHA